MVPVAPAENPTNPTLDALPLSPADLDSCNTASHGRLKWCRPAAGLRQGTRKSTLI